VPEEESRSGGGALPAAAAAAAAPERAGAAGGSRWPQTARASCAQGRLYRSTKLWAFYCDLEESLGTTESTRAVYDRILDLRIATPQIVLNYALFLEVPPSPRCPGRLGASLPSEARPVVTAPAPAPQTVGAP